MLRCLTIDSVVARPGVDGPHPVQFRPLCSFCSAAGTRQGFTAPFQSISFIDWDILTVGRKSASVSHILNTPSWRTDICAPGLIRLIGRNPFQKIGIDLMVGIREAGAGLRINRLQPHQPHQMADPLRIDRISPRPQPRRHLRHPVKRRFRKLLIDPVHKHQVVGVIPLRFVIHRRAGEPQEFTLPEDRNHRIGQFHKRLLCLYWSN